MTCTICRKANGTIEVVIPKNLSEDSVLSYCVNSYSFLLPLNKVCSFNEFADFISSYYCTENPRNNFVVRFLSSIGSM